MIRQKNVTIGYVVLSLLAGSAEAFSGNFTCENVQNGFETNIGNWGNQCVIYVRGETGIEYSCCNGYAKNCYDQAKDCGYSVGSSPKLGAIATFNSWRGNPYGHVGIVIGIDEKNNKIKLRHSNWHLDERVSEEWVSTKTYPLKGYVYCQGDACGGGGATNPDPSDPPASGKLPDFITNKVILAKENGQGERYTWKVNETAWVHAWVDNIGKANWEGKKDKIKVSFYLSKGTKKDSSSEWVRVGREEIKKKNVEVKDKPKHEKIAFNIPQWAAAGYIYPGRTYNFVVCADRPKDQDNGDGDVKEIHKSNNCSTEAVFYVDYVEPPEKSDLTAHSLQLNSGSTTLTGGSLYGMTVNMSNAGAGSADIGFQIKYEIKGPSTGGQWQTVGEKSFTAVPFAAGADQQISTNDSFAAAPTIEGDYLLRACADSKQAVAESNEGNNCSEALEVYVSPASEFLAKPVYRFWSSEQYSHFYTISEAEKDRVIAIYTPYQWQYERVEGCALPSQEDDSLPVYRFYSSPLTLHRFTISEEEKDSLMAMSETFKYEGIAWYAYTYQKEGTVPVYRFYSEAYKSYFYTVSEAERDLVLEKYPDEIWRYDGIAWYIFECP